MEELLNLLRDGHSRSIEMLAAELNITVDDVKRRIEFLERAGVIRRVKNTKSCSGCHGCKTHSGCIPENGFKNTGEMWLVNLKD
ncbi:MAG: Lrp/AsnC family transcriptional regulator [Treponema sp.]|nr:Lrp/AsnC family transcriptional regulator [Treponema sp.]